MFTDTFAGIAPSSALGYIGAQILGCIVGLIAVRGFFPKTEPAPSADAVSLTQPA